MFSVRVDLTRNLRPHRPGTSVRTFKDGQNRGFAKGVAGTVSLPIFQFFFCFLPFLPFFLCFLSVFFPFLPFVSFFSSFSFNCFLSVLFRFFLPFFSSVFFFRFFLPFFSSVFFFRFFLRFFLPFFSSVFFFRCFLPLFSSVFFRFFFSVSFSGKKNRGDTVRETPFAKPRQKRFSKSAKSDSVSLGREHDKSLSHCANPALHLGKQPRTGLPPCKNQERKNSININFLVRISLGHLTLTPGRLWVKKFLPIAGAAVFGADVHDFWRGRQ